MRVRWSILSKSVKSVATASIRSRSRSDFAPAARAFSTAARPFSSAATGRELANGFPQRLIATPHQAMPHDGSFSPTPVKAAAAALNQKECNSATPRVSSACTAGAQELSNFTVPNCCGGTPVSCGCCIGAADCGDDRAIVNAAASVKLSIDPPGSHHPTMGECRVRKDDLLRILHSLQNSGFKDLAGTDIAATVPVSERLLNEFVAGALATNRHVREAHVQPEAGNRFSVRVAPRAAMLPSLTIKLEIVRQPTLPQSPELVLKMATMGGLFGMATAALPIAQMMPAGVRLDGDLIHVDLRAFAAQSGAGDALQYVKELRVTTDPGRVTLQVHA